MLFNSYIFIFLFLPISIIGFFTLGKRGHHRVAMSWLVGMSLFFYGWWNPAYLGLIVISMLFNYAVGVSLSSEYNSKLRKNLLIFGVSANLALLGYYKYAGFFVENIELVLDVDFNLQAIILPLAISFFTFQQIAYLIDAYKGQTKEYNFLHYCLFVTFFPQLIAGPIVHHKEMLPQFARDSIYKYSPTHFAIGITIFTLGLFKKVILADGVAIYASPAFLAADQGVALTFFEAWSGALSYTLQLYFDFSGYSDMAIGVARMFGIRLPLNFNSPYKATNIIDFWRRWHMTLSRFLRDYLYIPLGGSRKGSARRQVNLMVTMMLGGLWHGAGWNFIIWGALHGFYLMINHLWRALVPIKYGKGQAVKGISWCITFFAIVIAWVPFRATTMEGTKNIWMGMLGLNGVTMQNLQDISQYLWRVQTWLRDHGVVFNNYIIQYEVPDDMHLSLLYLLVIVIAFPNTQQFMRRYRPALETYKGEIRPLNWSWQYWRLSSGRAFLISILLVISTLDLSKISEFLYFQF